MSLVSQLVVAVLVVGVLSACATNPVTGESDFVLMSEDQEITLGRQAHAEVVQQYGRYEDPALQAYVQRIGERLAAKSHRSNLYYRFTVLDSEAVNAFALPGGYIYITRGLLAYLNSEAELAAVLGHELGHVTARHSVRQYSAQQAANLGYILSSVIVPEMQTQGARDLFDIFGTAALRGYGREHELEADRLGAQYLARSGYDPEAILQVLRVLKNQELFEKQRARQEGRKPRVYHGLFATHPDNDTRLQQVVGDARMLKGPGQTIVNREEYLQRIDGLTIGPSAREGVLRGRDFYHAELNMSLRFPADWRVDNRRDRLLAYSPTNDAVLQVTVTDLNRRIPPRQFILERLGVQDLYDDKPITVNGAPGHTGFASAGTPWGRRLARYTVVFLDNRAYVFVSSAKNRAKPRSYDRAMLDTAFSLNPLTEEEAEKARELKLRVVSAGSRTRFADLAADSPVKTYAEEQLRLLNARYPKGEPTPGQKVKIIR